MGAVEVRFHFFLKNEACLTPARILQIALHGCVETFVFKGKRIGAASLAKLATGHGRRELHPLRRSSVRQRRRETLLLRRLVLRLAVGRVDQLDRQVCVGVDLLHGQLLVLGKVCLVLL